MLLPLVSGSPGISYWGGKTPRAVENFVKKNVPIRGLVARQVAILHPGALGFGAHAPGAFTGFASMPHQAVLTHGMGDLADC